MDSEIARNVKLIVNDNSGGIKFTELIVRMFEAGFPDISVDILEEEIRKCSDLRILEYTWHPVNRAKMFVYTP